MSKLSVEAGYCTSSSNSTAAGYCSLQPNEDCEVFVSSRWMLEPTEEFGSEAVSCASKESTENVVIGSCPEGCASDASACSDPSEYVDYDVECIVKGMDKPTLYGRCTEDDTCYWSKDDCTDVDAWTSAYHESIEPCTCDIVRVGACLEDESYHCAVSEMACGSNEEWVDARTLKDLIDKPDCFLCANGMEGTDMTPDSNNLRTGESGRKPMSTGQIAGFLAGGLVLCSIWIFSTRFLRKKVTPPGIPKDTSTAKMIKVALSEDLSDDDDEKLLSDLVDDLSDSGSSKGEDKGSGDEKDTSVTESDHNC